MVLLVSFTFYNLHRFHYDNFYPVDVLKNANDTAIIGLCNNRVPLCVTNYYLAIEHTIDLCRDSYLFIHGKETKIRINC